MQNDHTHRRGNAPDTPIDRATLLVDAAALVDYLRHTLADQPVVQPPVGIVSSARAAAVLAPLYASAGRPHMLFTLRSLDLSRHSGEISFPGGRSDAADTSLEATALRETYEELGVVPNRVEVLGPLPSVFTGVSSYLITPFIGWLGDVLPSLTPSPAEVAEVIDAPLAALADPAIHHSEIWRRGGVEHLIHFYDFGHYRIWGATGHMLHSFLTLLPPT